MLIFFPWHFTDSLALDLGAPTIADGRVTHTQKIAMTENDVRIYSYTFSFAPEGGERISGVSYTRGKRFRRGQRVKVEYLKGRPQVCRIKGARVDPFGYATGFVVIFPLAGSLIGFFSWRARRRKIRLLSYGAFALGTIENVRGTDVYINNRQRFKITVAFDADGVAREITYNAYGHEVALAEEKMENGEKVGLLYDPLNPRHALVANTLIE